MPQVPPVQLVPVVYPVPMVAPDQQVRPGHPVVLVPQGPLALVNLVHAEKRANLVFPANRDPKETVVKWACAEILVLRVSQVATGFRVHPVCLVRSVDVVKLVNQARPDPEVLRAPKVPKGHPVKWVLLVRLVPEVMWDPRVCPATMACPEKTAERANAVRLAPRVSPD